MTNKKLKSGIFFIWAPLAAFSQQRKAYLSLNCFNILTPAAISTHQNVKNKLKELNLSCSSLEIIDTFIFLVREGGCFGIFIIFHYSIKW
jgi:hypothetical protein